MAIFTESRFRTIAQRLSPKGLSGYVNESRTFSKSYSSTSVFLSHAHQDIDKIEQAKKIFEHLGISIYVDWMDTTMPEKTSGETAQRIKNKIDENQKFVLLATNRAVSSKWCNWEVGIGDIKKYSSDSIAVIGLADNYGHWTGNEYLQIYPSIEEEDGTKRNSKGLTIEAGFYVFYPADENGSRRYVKLESWLQR